MENPFENLNPYEANNLVGHLVDAHKFNELHVLLKMEDRTKQNAWFSLKESIGDVEGYLADIAIAWDLVDREYLVNGIKSLIGLQCHYALITASINSLAKNIPPTMIAALVRQGIWKVTQGIGYAQQAPNKLQRIEALSLLYNYATSEDRREKIFQTILGMGREIIHEQKRQEMISFTQGKKTLLAMIAMIAGNRHYDEKKELIHIVCVIICSIKDGEQQITLIRELASKTSEWGLTAETVKILNLEKDKQRRIELLSSIIPEAKEPCRSNLINYFMKLVFSVLRGKDIYDHLNKISSYASRINKNKALELYKVDDDPSRIIVLAPLLSNLQTQKREEYQRIALKVIRNISTIYEKALSLIMIISLVPRKSKALIFEEAFELTLHLEKGRDRQDLLLRLLAAHRKKPSLFGSKLQNLFTEVKIELSNMHKIETILSFYPYLPRYLRYELFKKMLAIARSEKHMSNRIDYLIKMINEPSIFVQKQYFKALLMATDEISTGHYRDQVLRRIAYNLAKHGFLDDAIDILGKISLIRNRGEIIAQIAPYFQEAHFHTLLDIAINLPLVDNYSLEDIAENRGVVPRRTALEGLSSYLPKDLLYDAMTTIRNIGDFRSLIELQVELLSYLPKEKVKDMLLKISGQDVSSVIFLFKVISRHLPNLPEDSIFAVLDLLRNLPEEDEVYGSPRVRAQISAAKYLVNPYKKTILDESYALLMGLAKKNGSTDNFFELVTDVCPLLASEGLDEQVAKLSSLITEEEKTFELNVMMAAYLQEDKRKELLDTLLTKNGHNASDWLEKLAPLLSETHIQEVLCTMLQTDNSVYRISPIDVLNNLAPILSIESAWKALSIARGLPLGIWRDNVLSVLFLRLDKLGFPNDAISHAEEIFDRGTRAKMIAQINSPIPESLLRQSIAATWVMDPAEQSRFLALLLPRLASCGFLQEAMVAIRTIRDDYYKVLATVSLLQYINPENEYRVTVKTMRDAINLPGYDPFFLGNLRASALNQIIPYLANLEFSKIKAVWIGESEKLSVLRMLAKNDRLELLTDLFMLVRIIRILGGEESIFELNEAVTKAGEWWP